MFFVACSSLLLSSCDTYTGSGAYAGATFGSILGSAIGGLSGGPRGSDMGTIIGKMCIRDRLCSKPFNSSGSC